MPDYIYEADPPEEEPVKPNLMDVITALEARVTALEQATQPEALNRALGLHIQRQAHTQMITPPGEQL